MFSVVPTPEQQQMEGLSSSSERALDIAKYIIAKTEEPILASGKQKKLDELLS